MSKNAVLIVVSIPKADYEKTFYKKKAVTKVTYHDLQNYDEVNENTLEKILDESLKDLNIKNVIWISSNDDRYYQVYFSIDFYENDQVLGYLQDKGIGIQKDTSVGFIPFELFYETNEDIDQSSSDSYDQLCPVKSINGFKKNQQDFLKAVTSRLTVAQVVEGIRASASLSFDFLAYTIFAGFIAAAGLLNNSPVDIAAAMMIEPVISTVMAVCFGMIIHDRGLMRMGWINLFIVLLICCLIGFLYGLIFLIWSEEWNPPPHGVWPTPEMETRGVLRTLAYGLLQSMGAGGAVAISLLNNAQCPLVGVAVASSFLPPHINAGLLWAYACHLQWRGLSQNYIPYNTSEGKIEYLKLAWIPNPKYQVHFYYDMRYESLYLSGVSLLLTYVNVIGMISIAYIMLWIKQFLPMSKLDTHRRFFKEDIKVARDYNRKSMGVIAADNQMGKQILQEWADIAGLDPTQLLSDKPEAKVTQIQTLKDLICDVESDDVYRSVTRGAIGRPEHGPLLLRRLTQASINFKPRNLSNLNLTKEDENNCNDCGIRRFSISRVLEKASKWFPTNNDQEETVNTVQSEMSFNRGLRPQEIESRGRRKSSVALRRELMDTGHLPYSFWPSTSARRNSRVELNEPRRRMSKTPRFSISKCEDSNHPKVSQIFKQI